MPQNVISLKKPGKVKSLSMFASVPLSRLPNLWKCVKLNHAMPKETYNKEGSGTRIRNE